MHGGVQNMDYRKSYHLLHAGVGGGAVVVFIGLSLSMKTGFVGFMGNAVAFIGLAAMLGSVLQAFLFCKCPKCGTLLKIRGKKPNCCHGCGYELDL